MHNLHYSEGYAGVVLGSCLGRVKVVLGSNRKMYNYSIFMHKIYILCIIQFSLKVSIINKYTNKDLN